MTSNLPFLYRAPRGVGTPSTTKVSEVPEQVIETALPGDFQPSEMAHALRKHLTLCSEVMELTVQENQALTGEAGYESSRFQHRRKNLLPRLEESLMSLSTWRKRWQQVDAVGRAGCSEVKSLSNAVQISLTKILLLDRENQQALLRRGLLPASHLPAAAAVQRPHCVADAYRRHSRA